MKKDKWPFKKVFSPSISLTKEIFEDSLKRIYKINPDAPWLRKDLNELGKKIFK